MITITPFGAAGEVTGSSYFVQTSQARVLVDFGLFQGDKEDDAKNIVPGALHRSTIDAIVLTHGHLDHCGRLPMLVREGYGGPIYCTSATRDLAELVMRDSAHIMEHDFERRKKRASRKGGKINRNDQPIFDDGDVTATIKLMVDVDYNAPREIAPGFTMKLYEAGHMLGSASIALVVSDEGVRKTIVFSGDLGPLELPYLRDPNPPETADVVIMESTYGDRDHRPLQETEDEFAQIIKDVVANKGKIFIPSFAIGRTQQMLFHLAELFRKGIVPKIPIFVDSPMGISATKIYTHHTDLFDEESAALNASGAFAKDLSSVKFTGDAEESRAINDVEGPFVVIAGAGMCNAGRILHHLRHNLGDPNSHVVIVGYQARGSLGRRLVDGVDEVSIMGDRIRIRAQIHTLGGFSAHAGQSELINWFGHIASHASPQLFLTHGEDDARFTLAARIKEKFGVRAYLPVYSEILQIA
jgi:metallo-beta-lactamase family protein